MWHGLGLCRVLKRSANARLTGHRDHVAFVDLGLEALVVDSHIVSS